jgi:hypothetical protein
MRLSHKEKKLLILAFDSAAEVGEAVAAIRALIKVWISKYPDGYSLIQDLEAPGEVVMREKIVYRNESPYGNFVLNFGKHRGAPLQDIPVSYLLWILEILKTSTPQRGKQSRATWKENNVKQRKPIPYPVSEEDERGPGYDCWRDPRIEFTELVIHRDHTVSYRTWYYTEGFSKWVVRTEWFPTGVIYLLKPKRFRRVKSQLQNHPIWGSCKELMETINRFPNADHPWEKSV